MSTRDASHGTPHVDPALLSAFHDDALDPEERQRIDAHLTRCSACRLRLATYASLGHALRQGEAATTPTTLDARVARMIEGASAGAPSRAGTLRLVWSVGVAAVFVGVFLVGLYVGQVTRVGPSVVAAYSCNTPSECTLAVQFHGPVDRAHVERSLHIDPPVPLTVAWRDDTLLIKPSEPLQPSRSYTLSLEAGRGVEAAKPVAIHLLASEHDGHVAVVQDVSSVVARAPFFGGQPHATPRDAPLEGDAAVGIVALQSASPLPPTRREAGAGPSPDLATLAVPSPAGTPCPVEPVRGFGTLYRSRPAVALRLGCARGPEHGVDLAVQTFARGRLWWRSDVRLALATLDDGTWRAVQGAFDASATPVPTPGALVRGFGALLRGHPELQEALGPPTAPDAVVWGAVEEFEGGLLLWSEERTIYVLYRDGTWESYPDTFQEATATTTPPPGGTGRGAPTPTAAGAPPTSPTFGTPTPAGPTATPPPTVASDLVPSPTGVACAVQPVRGFGKVYHEHPRVAARLGCARASEVGIPVRRQQFEGGTMIWRGDVRQIIVLANDGSWSAHPDTWQEGEALPPVPGAPVGALVPERAFGKLWREHTPVRQALGWATGADESLPGAVEEFDGGLMLWTGDRIVYALYDDSSWQGFVDTFVDPTPTPTPPPARSS